MENVERTKKCIEAFAEALRALGWDARADGIWLRVAENPNLRSPSVRGLMYVWDGYSAKKPETMARRLDRFLREVGKVPSRPAV